MLGHVVKRVQEPPKIHEFSLVNAAISRNTQELEKQIVLHQNRINKQDGDGRTPGFYAAWSGKIESLKLLRDAGATFEHRDKDGNTPLIMAAANGHAKCVDFLIKQGNKGCQKANKTQ